MSDGPRFAIILVLLGAAGAGAWFFWLRPHAEAPLPAQVAEPAPPPPEPGAALPDAAPVPSIRHPLKAAAGRGAHSASPDDPDSQAEQALKGLLGRKAVNEFLKTTDFVHGFVATVDSLATPFGSPHSWPVKAMAGSFVVEREGNAMAFGEANFKRYAPLIALLTSVNTQRAVQLYVQFYPMFQQAYEQMGYPGKYFNDRVVETIDHLLAAPTPSAPIAVTRIEVEGTTSPSGAYAFLDPGLERRTVGEKILMRVGAENAKRIKAKLAAVRAQIADGALPQ